MTLDELKTTLDAHKRRYIEVTYDDPEGGAPVYWGGYVISVDPPIEQLPGKWAVPVSVDYGYEFYVYLDGLRIETPTPEYPLTEVQLNVVEEEFSRG